MSNSLAPAGRQKFSTVIHSDMYKKIINDTLGDSKRAIRFVASISSAVATNPMLQECEPPSIISAALLGESLGLSPSTQLGQYWIVPYGAKGGGKKAQFQLGIYGYIQLAMRTGQYRDLDAVEVREGEYKGRDPQTGKPRFEFISDDEVRDALPVVGYLAYFELLNGFKKSVYFSYERMLRHADKYSKAFSRTSYEKLLAGEIPKNELWRYSSPWYEGFDGMALKTVLRQLLSKWGIMSIELQNALEKDMGVISDDGSVRYIDNEPDEADIPTEAIIVGDVAPDDDPLS